jgi:hypothetical protein
VFLARSSSSIGCTKFGCDSWSISTFVLLGEDQMFSSLALLGGDISLWFREDLDLFHKVKEWLVEGVNEVGYLQKVNGEEGSHKISGGGLSLKRSKKCVRKKGVLCA